jgi:hypothetical protein
MTTTKVPTEGERQMYSDEDRSQFALNVDGLSVSATGSLVVPVARDRDLRLILEDCGLLKAFEAGELTCEHCQTRLSWENLGAVVTAADGLKLCCDLSECIEQATAPHD